MVDMGTMPRQMGDVTALHHHLGEPHHLGDMEVKYSLEIVIWTLTDPAPTLGLGHLRAPFRLDRDLGLLREETRGTDVETVHHQPEEEGEGGVQATQVFLAIVIGVEAEAEAVTDVGKLNDVFFETPLIVL